ncbi:unnamed protein product [Durusdinium trenchii]|uniref:Uncharacterized protein n=1 Tax=Durusdinium trenchii TaxID=1381693 RepID=A0ABP0IFI6_9DINO
MAQLESHYVYGRWVTCFHHLRSFMDDPHADELPGLERLAESEFAEDEEDSASEGSAASLPLLDEAELDGEILIEAPPEEWDVEMKEEESQDGRPCRSCCTPRLETPAG